MTEYGARILLKSLYNTRDLGGFPTEDGRRIRPCKLIRSGQLCGALPEDLKILLEDYKLSVIVDFRTDTERAERPDPELPGVANIWNPILDSATAGITRESDQKADIEKLFSLNRDPGEAAKEYMEQMYLDIIGSPYSGGQYRRFFDILLEERKGSVLWHCSAGKDRVGIATLLLLTALGCSEERIVADYVKTQEFLAEESREFIRMLCAQYQKPELEPVISAMCGVEERYIRRTCAWMREHYGSVRAYLAEAIGVSEAETEALRNIYLE